MFRKSYVFDDVLLVPKLTNASSRKCIDISVNLNKIGRLSIPIISANTQWCTESKMAIAIARMGGLGIIHRMCTIETQVSHVHAVKARAGSDFTHEKDFDPTLDKDGKLKVGASVGIVDDYFDRAIQLISSGVDFITVDVAHGHSTRALNAIKNLTHSFPEIPLIAGNVATAQGVIELARAGASVIKVGIGPGSVCTTRLVTGAGVPQLTAIMDCVQAGKELGVSIIADGGIKSSGDIVKALAAGASCVMLGRMIAGTNESAAELIEIEGKKYKATRGFVTFGTKLELRRLQGKKIPTEEYIRYVPEGVEACFEYIGSLREYLYQLIGGIQSGFSYSGASNYQELISNHEFIQVSLQTQQENLPHALNIYGTPPIDYNKEVVYSDD
ncbi:MAG: IMP dehydrogenase [Candidatus Dasytiphilus stammeri]